MAYPSDMKATWHEYRRQYLASDGFDIDVYPTGRRVFNCTTPMESEEFEEHLDLLTRLSDLAIEVYNKDNNTNYKLVKVVKTTQRMCAGFEFRITFEATEDATDGQPKIFQASVYNGIETDKVNFCRLKTTN